MKRDARREMKESGVEWLGEIPADWKMYRLRWSVETSKNGVWGEEPDGEKDDIPCVRVADFDRQGLCVSGEIPTIRKVTASERKGRVLRFRDLLIEKSGGGEQQPVGCVVIYNLDQPAVCSNFVARLTPSDIADSNFFRYVHATAYALRLNVKAIKQTTGIQNLDTDAYFNEPVAFPPLPEQHIIADFLDRKTAQIDSLIAKKQRMIELLGEKRQVLISQAVTRGLDPKVPMKDSGIEWLGKIPKHWEVRRIATFADKVTNGYVGPTRDLFVDEGVTYLQSLHIKDNQIRFTPTYFVRAIAP